MASWNDSSDDKNPTFLFSLTHTELLVAIANGTIDPVALAKKELENRYLDNNGKHVSKRAA